MKTKNKKSYIKPKLEIIKIKKDEIIITSGPTPEGNSFGSINKGYNAF